MGANSFVNQVAIPDVREAFRRAVEGARWESGNGGYSGTIAEKGSYRILSREPLSGGELREFIDRRIDDNDKWGPAFAVPFSRVTEGKATTKTVTVRAKNEREARSLAAAKVRKRRKGSVAVRIKSVKCSGSPHSNKVRRKKHGGRAKVKWAWNVGAVERNDLYDTALDAAKAAEAHLTRMVAESESRGESSIFGGQDFTVFPVAVLEGGKGRAAYTVSIERNNKTVSWEVSVTVTPTKVEPGVAGWVFFGFASS